MMIVKNPVRVAALRAPAVVPAMEIQPHVVARVIEGLAHVACEGFGVESFRLVAAVELHVVHVPSRECVGIALVVRPRSHERVVATHGSNIGVQAELEAEIVDLGYEGRHAFREALGVALDFTRLVVPDAPAVIEVYMVVAGFAGADEVAVEIV